MIAFLRNLWFEVQYQWIFRSELREERKINGYLRSHGAIYQQLAHLMHIASTNGFEPHRFELTQSFFDYLEPSVKTTGFNPSPVPQEQTLFGLPISVIQDDYCIIKHAPIDAILIGHRTLYALNESPIDMYVYYPLSQYGKYAPC